MFFCASTCFIVLLALLSISVKVGCKWNCRCTSTPTGQLFPGQFKNSSELSCPFTGKPYSINLDQHQFKHSTNMQFVGCDQGYMRPNTWEGLDRGCVESLLLKTFLATYLFMNILPPSINYLLTYTKDHALANQVSFYY